MTEEPGTILYLSPVLWTAFDLFFNMNILQYERLFVVNRMHMFMNYFMKLYIWRILALELITFSYLHLTLGGVGLGVIGSVMIGYFRLKKRLVRSKMVFCIWLPTRIFKSWILIMISFPYQRGCKNALKLIFYILMTKTIW